MTRYRLFVLFTLAAVSCAALAWRNIPENRLMAAEKDAAKKSSQLAHMVFFTAARPEDRQPLIDACQKYLSNHPGVVYFSVGALNPDLKREVNDQDFDVALHLVFKDRAAHDTYQDSPRHQDFVNHKSLWKKVRVFDSDLQ